MQYATYVNAFPLILAHMGPGPCLSVPVGCERSLKAPPAQTLHVPYQSRSQWARAILDFVAEQLPGRSLRSFADGGYATKDDVR